MATLARTRLNTPTTITTSVRTRWPTIRLCLLATSLLLMSTVSSGSDDHHQQDDERRQTDQQATAFDREYREAKAAYAREEWPECVELINRSLQLYRRYRRELVECREQCGQSTDRGPPLPVVDLQLRFYERAIRQTLCLMRCLRAPVSSREQVADVRQLDVEFQNLEPYHYLQMCYFKVNDLHGAASAAYTFLLRNPDHQVMKNNFQYYTSQPQVDINNIRNLESQFYQEYFLKGNKAYNEKSYPEVIESFEKALAHYFQAEEECRLLCEGHFERGPTLDLTMTIANHFTFNLRCKQRCPEQLSHMYGEKYDDLLATHFHYLQFAYYQIEDIRHACEAVGTFLALHPTSEMMLHNKEYYTNKHSEVTPDYFQPRKEIVDYVKRDEDEKILLTFIEQNFVNLYAKKSSIVAPPDGDNNATTNDDSDNTDDQLPLSNEEHGSKTRSPIQLIQNEKQLHGVKRFVAEGFANESECGILIDLASDAAVHGDGYSGKATPHTKHENFEGLTIGRAAVLTKLGLISKESVQRFLEVSERSRQYVEKYFKLKRDSLYFSYTHLVCRTARPDAPNNRSDLSHPVHGDNCLLTKDGSCIKDKPAFTWRDFSAIVYLNDDFDGGNFIFATDAQNVQATVEPKCGRMVGFSAGGENLHGVQAVLSGRRCALAMWFTLDHDHREKERFLATQVLDLLVDDISSDDANFDEIATKNYIFTTSSTASLADVDHLFCAASINTTFADGPQSDSNFHTKLTDD